MFDPDLHWLFPIVPGTKKPAWPWTQRKMTRPEFNEWYAQDGQYANCLLGFATGERSGGIFVVDIDVGEGGTISEATSDRLLATEWPEGMVVATTPSGGEHRFFRGADDGNRAKIAGTGIDVRGTGGYVVLYPDADGRYPHYEDWLVPDATDSILALIRTPRPQVTGEQLAPGNRNDALTSMAGRLMRGGTPPEAALAELSAINAATPAPLPVPEVLQIVRSVARYHPQPQAVPQVAQWGETLAEIELLKLPPITSAIGPLMTGTTTILHGESGAGKSLFAEWMAVRMAQGAAHGNWQAPKPLRVLYLDQENPSGYIQQRFSGLQALAGDNLRVIHRDYLRRVGFRFNLTEADHRAILLTQSFDFLILDSLAAVAPGTENLPMSAAEWFFQIMDLCDEITNGGGGVLMLGNLNKAGGFYGSQAQEWRPDRNWSAEKWTARAAEPGVSAAMHIDGGKERGLGELTVKSKWYFDLAGGWIQAE